MKYIVWHDNDFDLAVWTVQNSILKDKEVQLRCIPKTNSPAQIAEYFKDPVTRKIMPFIRFETPDVIIQQIEPINKVLCVTELMTHTPQWQHPAQRFTRLYTSTILKIPTALIVAEFKVKWEKGSNTNYKKVQYHCSGSVYNLFVHSTEKNNNPTLLFHWPNMEGYLKYDPLHPTSPYVEGDIIEWFNFINNCIIKQGNLEKADYQKQLDMMRKNRQETPIETFETIEGLIDTDDFLSKYKIPKNKMSREFLNRKKTLIFKPNGLVCSVSEFRTDPYAGMLCAFDVIFCRDSNFNRIYNIVLIAKDVRTSKINYIANKHNDSDCCFMNETKPLTKEHLKTCSYTQPKYRRIYGEISDLVLFEDGVLMRKGEIL